MNILILNYEYPPSGGGGVFSKGLAIGLAERGHQIHLVTMDTKNVRTDTQTHENLHIYRIVSFRDAIGYESEFPLYIFPFISLPTIIKIIKRNQIDIINPHFVIPSGLLTPLVSKFENIPLVTNVMGADIYDPTRYRKKRLLLNTACKFVLNSSNLIIVPSKDMKKRTSQLTNTKIEIIPHFVDPDIFKPQESNYIQKNYNIESNKFIILTLSRLIERKNLETSLEIIKKLKMDGYLNIKYVIAGEGPLKEYLKKKVKVKGLNDYVIFTGRIPEADLPLMYSNADVFLLPSHHEAFGIVFLEAMSSGLPILASNVGGIKDIIIGGKNGFLCNAMNVICFENRLKKIIKNSELREKMGIFARQHVINNFSYKKIIESYEQLFKRVVKQKQ